MLHSIAKVATILKEINKNICYNVEVNICHQYLKGTCYYFNSDLKNTFVWQTLSEYRK